MKDLGFLQPPFNTLNNADRHYLKKHSQIRYLAKDEALKSDDLAAFFIVLKGQIAQKIGTDYVGEFIAREDHQDWFDGRRLPPDGGYYDYHALEDSLLLEMTPSALDTVCDRNPILKQQLSGEIADRVLALKALHLQSVMQIPLISVHLLAEDASLLEAAQSMTQAGLKHVLIQRPDYEDKHPTQSFYGRLGILTDTDICRAVSEGRDMTKTSCREFANFKVKTLQPTDDISEALMVMLRHRVHRLPVVAEDGKVIGVLGQTDLLAYISHHSQLISQQIERAQSVDDLAPAVEQIGQYIRLQQQNGVKIGVISRMVQTLNAHVFSKLWSLIVPENVFENTCVIVMGSEGRGEQILRTDQDNALIIRNGFNHKNLPDYAQTFNQDLAKLGYPLCTGNIMMQNPQWRLSLSRFEHQINQWFLQKDPNHSIWLAAVMDASYICGDENLLIALKNHLKIAHQNADPMFIRQFAKAALQFGDTNQWWQKFAPLLGKTQNDIDLKKAGIFPLVHGIRTLALENDLTAQSSTKDRLKALVQANKLTQNRANTLNETLEFFMAQRLNVALNTDDKQARQVNPKNLSALEKDLMKECLNIVKSFKNELKQHYQLEI